MAPLYPDHYDPHMTVRQTEEAIKYIRDLFQSEFGRIMHLERISAPLFVARSSGLNDNLNGIERPVSFEVKDLEANETFEIAQSLAKWKRFALKKYDFQPGEGLYTNMNALRPDEGLDNLHSVYVDQWDWERVITADNRTIEYLEQTVKVIFKIIKHIEYEVWYRYPDSAYHLPDDIYFVTTEELESRWPDKTRREREDLITKEHGAVFLEKIGWPLGDGRPHDGRAPDYDDWNLNGDILFWFEPLGRAIEISSMGIRVDAETLKKQLKVAHCENRLSLPFHRMLVSGDLPLSIGGGIGQSRLAMLLLGRVHIGEVQCSAWPETMRAQCEAHNIHLL